MRGPYPGELRIRVIHFVEAGGSRCEAAEQFQVSASSAIRWVQRFREDGVGLNGFAVGGGVVEGCGLVYLLGCRDRAPGV
jgi:transposase